MTCFRCNEDYDRNSDIQVNPTHDPEWDMRDGRCYLCYLDMLFDIYGGMLEPTFTITAPAVDIPF